MYFEGIASRIPDCFFLQDLTASETATQRRSSEVPLSWSVGGVKELRVGEGCQEGPWAWGSVWGKESRVRGRILLTQVTDQPQGRWALI